MSCKNKEEVGHYGNCSKKVMHNYNKMNAYQINQRDLTTDNNHRRHSNSQQTIFRPNEPTTQQMLNEQLQERYVWEMRSRSPNITPASTVLNSPDMNTDTQYVLQQQQRQHMQIHVGRSPGSQSEALDLLPQGIASPGSPTDVGKGDGRCLREGEIVVFDDIDTNWMNSSNNYSSKTSMSPSTYQNNEDILKVTKMIGQLPIAEYEGSPRRFGSQTNTSSSSKTVSLNSINGMAPRRPPGFPQRISPKHSLPAGAEASIDLQQVSNDDESKANSCKLIDFDGDVCEKQQSQRVELPAFEYLNECSETRKVLEQFFKSNMEEEEKQEEESAAKDPEENSQSSKHVDQTAVGQRLARIPNGELYLIHRSPKKAPTEISFSDHNIELYIDSNSRSSGELADTELEANLRRHSRNFTLSPETTDYDSNCGDLDSLSNDINCQTDYSKLYTSMPVLEDGLSSGHASDTENNGTMSFEKSDKKEEDLNGLGESEDILTYETVAQQQQQPQQVEIACDNCHDQGNLMQSSNNLMIMGDDSSQLHQFESSQGQYYHDLMTDSGCCNTSTRNNSNEFNLDTKYNPTYLASAQIATSANDPSHIRVSTNQPPVKQNEATDIIEAMKEIRSALQRAKTQPEKLKFCDEVLPADPDSPVWVPRNKVDNNYANICSNKNESNRILGGGNAGAAHEEEEHDTDLETDRLLGHQRPESKDPFDNEGLWPKTSRIGMCDGNERTHCIGELQIHTNNYMPQAFSSATIRQGIGTSLTPACTTDNCPLAGNDDDEDGFSCSPDQLKYSKTSPIGSIKSLKDINNSDKKVKTRNKEGYLEPAVLIEGVLFRARYLGSTQLVCEGQPTKSTRMMQAEEAVSRIKAPEGESQPSTEVDLFISTEKIMVLNTDLKEIMMDHALRTISYIADIGDLVVLMARRRFVPSPTDSNSDSNDTQSNSTKDTKDHLLSSNKHNRTPKMICHVFESDEAQFIAQSIGQAFQVAYMEFLKANGIENENLAKEMDYQEVLNSQEIFGDELEIFAKKELQKEVVVPKAKGEILGVVIVESGWGSMLPTVVIANLMSGGAAARCGQLNIGDQLIAINGLSLVGLPLSTCQNYIRNTKTQTAVKFTVVPCPPVVEVKIIRPKALFQLGFSVQNGVICSLLRGGIAERGGVRVGHRIIEINNQSVVAVPHDTIVKLLSSSVGEILMKTMPTSMFRLLTGQETPLYI